MCGNPPTAGGPAIACDLGAAGRNERGPRALSHPWPSPRHRTARNTNMGGRGRWHLPHVPDPHSSESTKTAKNPSLLAPCCSEPPQQGPDASCCSCALSPPF